MVASLQPSLFLFERLVPINRNALHHTSQSAAFFKLPNETSSNAKILLLCREESSNRHSSLSNCDNSGASLSDSTDFMKTKLRDAHDPNSLCQIKTLCKTSTMKKHLKRLLSEERKEVNILGRAISGHFKSFLKAPLAFSLNF